MRKRVETLDSGKGASRKLVLNRETVRQLTDNELSRVAGGCSASDPCHKKGGGGGGGGGGGTRKGC